MDLDQLKQKYASVLNMVQQQQVRLSHLNMDKDKLFIQGIAPSEDAKNKVWDQIKLVNSNWQQDLVADISVDPNASAAQPRAAQSGNGSQATAATGAKRTYTVKPGDKLSKISKEFYGNPNEYKKIFEANRDVLSDPNEIEARQTLTIPA